MTEILSALGASSWSLPAFLLSILGVAAVLLYILRDWERTVALMATGLTAVLIWWLFQIDLELPASLSFFAFSNLTTASQTFPQFGITLAVKEALIPLIITYFGLLGAAFLLTVRASQGRTFVPLALALLAGFAGLTLLVSGPVAPIFLTPLLLVGLSSLSAFALQAGRVETAGGIVRTLLPPILAFPLFLLATWYINEQIPLNPQDDSAVRIAGTLLTIGLLLILTPFPFHSAHSATAQTSPPIVSATLTLIYQLAAIHLFKMTLDTFPPIATLSPLYIWLTWAGILTAIWGGVAAMGATHPGRLWGYASLHDWGLILLVLAIPDVRRWPLVLLLFLLRAISMLTAAAGLSVMENRIGSLAPAHLQGVGERLYWNCAIYFIGGLGLVGFPLSAGFTGHWAALQIISTGDWRLATAVLLASAAAILGFIRMVRVLYGRLQNPFLARESYLSSGTAIVIGALSAGLAVFPQALNGMIDWLLTAFS